MKRPEFASVAGEDTISRDVEDWGPSPEVITREAAGKTPDEVGVPVAQGALGEELGALGALIRENVVDERGCVRGAGEAEQVSLVDATPRVDDL